jgi:AcrR family transcriptional regulator
MPTTTPAADPSAEVEVTRRQILEAAGEIIATEDFDALSMRRVAARAGVSLSTVVRHFGTKDALLTALISLGEADEERADHRGRIEPGDVAGAVRIVVDDYEESGQQLLHMLGQEHRYPALSELLDIGRRGHRSWVRWAFGPQLAGRSGARRSQLEDLFVIGTDLYTWKLLRLDRGLGVRATKAAMVELCESVAVR